MTCASTDGTTSTLPATNVDLAEIESVLGKKVVYNSPNPFNPTTTIHFLVPEPSTVRVDIYDILGKNIATLLNEKVEAGLQTTTWDGKDRFGNSVGSGTYFYVITINNRQMFRRKMLLLK